MNQIDLTSWEKFITTYVLPVFDLSQSDNYREYLKKIQTPFFPNYEMAVSFYSKIKYDERFDEELKLFFSFLYSCNFFGKYFITFENSLAMNNWSNPYSTNSEEPSINILELLKKENGVIYLKNNLRWMPFLNREDSN
jgi:hypothetical protein